jgi:hypothetical protein
LLIALIGLVTLALGGAAEAKPKKLGSVQTRTATAQGSGNDAILTATATCPKKSRAISGGFSGTPVTSDALPIIYESVKVGQRSWRTSSQIVDEVAPSDTVSLTSVVYCRKGAPKTSVVTNTAATPVPSPATPTGTSTATCRGNKLATAGGFFMPPPILTNGVPSDSFRISAVSWQVTVQILGATTVTSHVYCAKSKEPTPVTTTTSSSSQFAPTTTTAACAGKRNPLAGGFTMSGSTHLSTPPGVFYPYESLRADRKSWKASGVHGGTAATTLSAIAYCG